MRYLSTFSGIGGFELGITQAYEALCNAHGGEKRGVKKNKEGNQRQGLLAPAGESAGAKKRPTSASAPDVPNQRPLCVGYSEVDRYACEVYQKQFPTHKNYGDITKIKAEELPDFDLLVGGFPCQAFSIAGKRRGFEDTRGTMFFELARILRAKQPRLFLFENVKGLLSHDNGRTFKTIIATIDELGYDVQWQVLNSKNHGVPQNRERVFIVGHLRGTARPEVFPIKSNGGADFDGDYKIIDGYNRAYTKEIGTVRQNMGNGGSLIQLNNPTHSNDRVYGTDGLSPTLNTMQGGNRQPFVKVPEATKKGYAEATPGQSINLAVPNSKRVRLCSSLFART